MRDLLNAISLNFSVEIVRSWYVESSFWLPLAAEALFIIGLILILRKGAKRSRGQDSVAPFGRLFFGVSLAVFGMQHFVFFDSVKFGVPAWMPGRFFWAYFVGAGLIATCLSLLADVKANFAALLVGTMLFLFVLLIYVPNLVKNPQDRFAIIVPLRDLALSGGALALAGTLGAFGRPPPIRWLVMLGRWFFATPMVFFGIEHFLHPEFAPGVPLPKLMPGWVPAHVLWADLMGSILVVCGLSILFKKHDRLAATVLGIAFLVLVIFLYLPMEILHPSIAISGELDYVADTLAMSGAALLVACALEPLIKPRFESVR